MKRILTFDDFYEEAKTNVVPELELLKIKYPNLKATLFTVLDRCSLPFLQRYLMIDWLQVVPHGFHHESNDEVKQWSEKEAKERLALFSWLGMEKGFKAPDYQYSETFLQVAKKAGFWVAIKEDQEILLPKGIKYYNFMKDKRAVNSHTWLFESDEKKGMFKFSKNDEFMFASEALREK